MKNADNNYNTNLASEYLMMSLLCRTGKEAYLSLGNKKGVDIIVKTKQGSICVVEVKGVNKRNDWLIGNNGKFLASENLFYALICFNDKIAELTTSPDFWLIPSKLLAIEGQHKIASTGKTVFLSNKFIRENYQKYKNTFYFLEKYLVEN